MQIFPQYSFIQNNIRIQIYEFSSDFNNKNDVFKNFLLRNTANFLKYNVVAV
jgi:hypothetical protein